MQLLQVIPITKSINAEVLTYFSAKPVDLGTLVTVPLRKKDIKAIVVQNESVIDMKAQLRGASFQIRNVREVHDIQIFSPAFLRAVKNIKNFYATTTGQVLDQITPSFVLKDVEKWGIPNLERSISGSLRQMLLQRSYEDRTSTYRTMVREHMLQKTSMQIVCPTIESCGALFEVLKKNNRQVYLLHSGLTQKQSKDSYKEITGLTEPSVLISTPGFIDTYQQEKATVIIEEESSPYYRTLASPYLDMRVVVQEYAREAGTALIWAGSVLCPETYHLAKSHQAETMDPFNRKIFKAGDIKIISQHSKKKKRQSDAERIKELTEKGKFKSLSKEVVTILRKAIIKKQKIFLFTHRKGLAPTIVCQDCGNLARSPESGLPYALYIKTHPKTRKKERVFVCTMSGESLPAFDTCQFCQGHNLTQLGIGTERVHEEVTKLFPKTKTVIIDGTHVTTKKAMRELVDEYQKTKKAMIIIGTQKALGKLPFIDQAVVVSLDSYFSRMSYNTNPEILNLVSKLHESSREPLLLQSRNITEESLPILQKGMYLKYIKQELDLRREYDYPPYATVCVVKRVIPKNTIKKEYDFMNTCFNNFHPNIMTHPAMKKEMVTLVMILQLDYETWSREHQDDRLDTLLRGFERGTEVRFDPQHLV